MLISRLTAELTLKGALGAAVMVIGGFAFLYSWETALIAMIAMAGMNLLTELYTASCMRVGASTGIAGMAGQFVTVVCMLYLLYAAVCANWVGAVLTVLAVVIAACLPAISQLGQESPFEGHPEHRL